MSPHQRIGTIVILATVLAAVPFVRTAGGEEAKSGAPAAGTRQVPPEDTVINELNVQDVPLDQLLQTVQKLVPDYKATVMHPPGSGSDLPLITLNLKGITLGQLVQLLQENYGVVREQIPGANGDLNVFRYQPPADEVEAQLVSPVQIYPLAGIVNTLVKSRPEAEKDPAAGKKALDDILSLIKAAMDKASEGGPAPSLQVHQETVTLIFKGNSPQRMVLENVLGAMEGHDPVVEDREAKLKEQSAALEKSLVQEKIASDAKLDELNAQLQSMRKQLDVREVMYLDTKEQLQQLQMQLADLQGRKPASGGGAKN